MKKSLLAVFGLLVLVVPLALWLDPTKILLGWLRGEQFFQGRPTSYWSVALQGQDPRPHSQTVQALRDGGQDAIPVLVELLQSDGGSDWSTFQTRWQAANLLRQLGPESKDAVPALVACLNEEDAHLRAVALAAIEASGVFPHDAVPQLLKFLQTDQRLSAVRWLGRLGPAAKPAVARLTELLEDADPNVRWNAARTLGRIGPDAGTAVPALAASLKDSEAQVREYAAEALGRFGPVAKDAVEALIRALADNDARVRRDAVRSLGQIGPAAASAAPAVKKLLSDPDIHVRETCRRVLPQLGRE